MLAVREEVGDGVVVFADANCGFSLSSARRFVRELGVCGAGVFLEQPCATLQDCARLRTSWDGPMVMDESIVPLAALVGANRLGVADGVWACPRFYPIGSWWIVPCGRMSFQTGRVVVRLRGA